MIHKGENYSVKLQKYYFCNGTKYVIPIYSTASKTCSKNSADFDKLRSHLEATNKACSYRYTRDKVFDIPGHQSYPRIQLSLYSQFSCLLIDKDIFCQIPRQT